VNNNNRSSNNLTFIKYSLQLIRELSFKVGGLCLPRYQLLVMDICIYYLPNQINDGYYPHVRVLNMKRCNYPKYYTNNQDNNSSSYKSQIDVSNSCDQNCKYNNARLFAN